MKCKVLFFFLIALLLFHSTFALDVQGLKLSPITFEPGKTIINHYIITGTNKPVVAELSGSLIEYVQITEIVNNEFDLIIKVPEKLPEPGTYWFSMHVKETDENAAAGIGSLLSITLRFQVEVPPHGKKISISFSVPDINEDQPMNFVISVQSRGLENIDSLQGQITVYDLLNNSVGTVNTAEKSLTALSSGELTAVFETKNLLPANYWAEAIVFYDGEQMSTSDTFKIGNLDLILVNYTQVLEHGFAEFKALIENNWGNPLETVYAQLFINGTEFLHTPTISLAPWQRGELKGIIKTNLNPGEYDAVLKLFFDKESKEEPIKIIISDVEQKKPEDSSRSEQKIIILALISILTVATIAVWFWSRKRGNNSGRI